MTRVDFDSVCDAIIAHIGQESSEPIDRDTLLLEKTIVDSFSILGLILFLEELPSMKIQPDNLATKNFASVSAVAKWAMGQVESS